MKILINNGIGGYSISDRGVAEYLYRIHGERPFAYTEIIDDDHDIIGFVKTEPGDKHECVFSFHDYGDGVVEYVTDRLDTFELHFGFDGMRTDETLISILEELGSDFLSGQYASLTIVEIPDDISYTINDTGMGYERVEEKHRYWAAGSSIDGEWSV